MEFARAVTQVIHVVSIWIGVLVDNPNRHEQSVEKRRYGNLASWEAGTSGLWEKYMFPIIISHAWRMFSSQKTNYTQRPAVPPNVCKASGAQTDTFWAYKMTPKLLTELLPLQQERAFVQLN